MWRERSPSLQRSYKATPSAVEGMPPAHVSVGWNVGLQSTKSGRRTSTLPICLPINFSRTTRRASMGSRSTPLSTGCQLRRRSRIGATPTPENFRFAIKASQQITHRQRLKVPSDALVYFHSLLPTLGTKLGIVLYQLPPNFKFDLPRLEAFLGALPAGPRSAFEFRHVSWFVDETFRLLENTVLPLHQRHRGVRLPGPAHRQVHVRAFATRQYGHELRATWKQRLSDFAKNGIDVFRVDQAQGQPRFSVDCPSISPTASPRRKSTVSSKPAPEVPRGWGPDRTCSGGAGAEPPKLIGKPHWPPLDT